MDEVESLSNASRNPVRAVFGFFADLDPGVTGASGWRFLRLVNANSGRDAWWGAHLRPRDCGNQPNRLIFHQHRAWRSPESLNNRTVKAAVMIESVLSSILDKIWTIPMGFSYLVGPVNGIGRVDASQHPIFSTRECSNLQVLFLV